MLAAGRAGIYASVMLFEGFSLHLTATPDNIEGHPFHAANNVNDIAISSIVDYQVLPLDSRVEALQQAYIRKVIDTVHDLPNVLYEVANESSGETADSVVIPGGFSIETPIGDSTQWQYWVINTVKDYEREMGYDSHPIGMTYLYPVAELTASNEPLWNSPADWISPGFDDTLGEGRWFANPPANDGKKVVLLDTDHFSPFSSNALWVWKAFLRGHHPILYDLGILGGGMPPDPSQGNPSFNSLEPARMAMGDTRDFAERISLMTMQPRPDLSSTGFELADPGKEYLILQPSETADQFTITLIGRPVRRRMAQLAEPRHGSRRDTDGSRPGQDQHERPVGNPRSGSRASPPHLRLRARGHSRLGKELIIDSSLRASPDQVACLSNMITSRHVVSPIDRGRSSGPQVSEPHPAAGAPFRSPATAGGSRCCPCWGRSRGALRSSPGLL